MAPGDTTVGRTPNCQVRRPERPLAGLTKRLNAVVVRAVASHFLRVYAQRSGLRPASFVLGSPIQSPQFVCRKSLSDSQARWLSQRLKEHSSVPSHFCCFPGKQISRSTQPILRRSPRLRTRFICNRRDRRARARAQPVFARRKNGVDASG
jgi:hypothetical protein